MGPAAISTDGLSRRFATGVALDALTLEVGAGEVLALLGPNGAGKTTTVRLLNGVLRPDSGRATVLGLDPTVAGDEVRRRTGVLTENAGLDDRLTALENLELVARMRGFTAAAARQRSTALLERFTMADRADHLVQGFSTGQRKRLALARALLHDPEVLFLDEPTSGLDPAATRDVIDLVGSLATEHGRTVVLCTHFLGEAGRLASRVGVLHHGRLRAFGRPEDLAAALLPGVPVDIELAAAADDRILGLLAALPGVRTPGATSFGLRLVVDHRDRLPAVVAALVGCEVPVFAAIPRPPSLEDVYFEVQARIAAEEAASP
ncbi:MAG: ABC transporter ATP-binding protein [Acidimicrobiia bacterium]|nr:ABC transporter ATP-binding protein [Acidimicrobiia bacterium]